MEDKGHEVEGSPYYFRGTEEKVLRIDISRITGTPTSPLAAIYDSNEADKSSTMLLGDPSIDGYEFVTPLIKNAVRGEIYKLWMTATYTGNKISVYAEIRGI